jgi:nucleotidyltransferase substrate binding protein (TIGR01987 family)
MANNEELRWLQRMEHMERAYAQLSSACERQSYSDLELAGLVQTFQFTFDLAWKTLRDLLIYEGYEANSPREALQRAFAAGILQQIDMWLQALASRNHLTHTYNRKTAAEAQRLIQTVYWPMLAQLVETLRQRKPQADALRLPRRGFFPPVRGGGV